MNVLSYLAAPLLGLALLLHSSPVLVFHPVEPPAHTPRALGAGEIFLIEQDSFQGWRIDGRPLTHLGGGQLMGATPLSESAAVLSAWKKERGDFKYFWAEVPLKHQPHQTRHKALRIPAATWSKLQTDDSKALRDEQRHRFREVLRSSPDHSSPLCWVKPLKSRTTSKFGKARVLPNGEMYHHTGLDLAARTGTPIYPAASGVVALSDEFVVSGGLVVLYHGYNLATTYAHLSRRDVQVGQELTSSQSLGLSGATGRVTGPHLHWEFFWRDRPVDPAQALETLQGLCDPA